MVKRREYDQTLKNLVVALYLAGMPRADILKEFGLDETTFDSWVKHAEKLEYTPNLNDILAGAEGNINADLKSENQKNELKLVSIIVDLFTALRNYGIDEGELNGHDIDISYNRDEEIFRNEGLVNLVLSIDFTTWNINFKTIILSEVKVTSYKKYKNLDELMKKRMKDLISPSISKANLMISSMLTDMIGFPYTVNLFEEFANELSKDYFDSDDFTDSHLIDLFDN
ncbi:hypothetical protein BG262_00490 [Floricoccus penangensis]|uniref:Transposase n=1 Tax=Floricoccus penangensis TaxID=1859475 RepID=A0A9Q5JIW9_9LACT|nr:hypothetical protein [Floricoccus penangensis]OFI48013.1 hypothetical protein BG262_00490 [Floricoccus penangensis]